MSPRRTLLGLMTMMIALTGCGTSPPVSFYSLEPLPMEYGETEDDALIIGLGPLRLAEYLKRSQMITRGSDSRILVDERTHWAEPLEPAIHRIIAMNVDGLLDFAAVVAFPDTDTAGLDYRVIGRIHRFDVDTAGNAVLQVQWRIDDSGGTTVVKPRWDRYDATVAAPNDAGARVAAMTDLLGQFSRRVADSARGLPSGSGAQET